jgi:invasion protein IalB
MRRAVTCAAVALGAYAGLTGLAIAKPKQPEKAPAAQQAPSGKADNKAEKTDKAAKQAAPVPNAKQSQQPAWVKLCEKATLQNRGKDGKDVKEEKNICLTNLELLDGNTGILLISAGIRQVEGNDKRDLVVKVPTVPIGMAIQPGLRVAVYPKELWEKAQKNEKIDEKQLKSVELKYSLCHLAGCNAEVEASPELVESLKTGGGLVVLAMSAAAKPVAFPVPLEGFNAAYSGPPVDNQVYAQARGQFIQQVRQRQAELLKQHQAQQAQATGSAPAPQPQPGPAQAAPAKK